MSCVGRLLRLSWRRLLALLCLISRGVPRLAGGGSPLTRFLLRLARNDAILTPPVLRRAHRQSFGGGEIEWLEPISAATEDGAVFVWLPGGAFIAHDGYELGLSSALLTRFVAKGLRVPRVLVLRYGLPAREGTTVAWLQLALRTFCAGKRLIVAGDSAGGHLAVSNLILRGEESPAPVLAICPWLDLTHTSAAHARNAGVDSIHITLLEYGVSRFLGERTSREDASPVHASDER
ncbi:MAG: hypothetical protein SGPRY_011351 [Prymnesium sp.]